MYLLYVLSFLLHTPSHLHILTSPHPHILTHTPSHTHTQDEPLIPEDDVDRKAKRQQPDEDNSAEIEAASFKKFHMEVTALSRVSELN